MKTELSVALRQVRPVLGVAGLFSFFVSALMLTVSLYMLQVYDRVLTSRHVGTLVLLTILALGLLLFGAVLDWLRARLFVRISLKLDRALAGAVFSAAFLRLVRTGQGSQGQPMRDIETLRQFLTGSGIIALFDAPWAVVFLLVIFLIHPLLGVIAVSGMAILLVLAGVGEFIARKPLQEAAAHGVMAYAFAEANMLNAEVVHTMGMLPRLRARWLLQHEQMLAGQSRAGERAASLTAAAKFFRQILQVIMLGAGAWLVLQRITTPGVMVACSIILGRALAPVEAAIGSWRALLSARGSYARLHGLLAAAGAETPRLDLPRPTGRLQVEDIVALPPGATRPVLHGVSFRLDAGEILGIAGPAAAGKSTLARLLVGAASPRAGQIRLDDADLVQWHPDALGPHLGYLPQNVELLAGTVAENIARFGPIDAGAVVLAAQRAGVDAMVRRLPDGYNTMIGSFGANLSGGQRQRIALARALYGNPVLVVLDEPNANLDGDGEAALRDAILAQKAESTTVVVIAHRPSILSATDRLLVLRDGRVDMFGATADVLPRIIHPTHAQMPLRPAAAMAAL
jgi:PrtD family type I secretion system ABC transporter